MSWGIGYNTEWNRDIGYGVPAICDHPGCGQAIDRGLSYVCGGEYAPYGGDHGCGLHFCSRHLRYAGRRRDHAKLCERCYRGKEPFTPTADVPVWKAWKLTDQSWAEWRKENPGEVQAIRQEMSDADAKRIIAEYEARGDAE